MISRAGESMGLIHHHHPLVVKCVTGGLQGDSDFSGVMPVIVDQLALPADQRTSPNPRSVSHAPNSASPLTMASSEIPSSAQSAAAPAAFWALWSPHVDGQRQWRSIVGADQSK